MGQSRLVADTVGGTAGAEGGEFVNEVLVYLVAGGQTGTDAVNHPLQGILGRHQVGNDRERLRSIGNLGQCSTTQGA